MARRRLERLVVQVLPETKEGLRRAAQRRGVSMSELVRAAAKRGGFDELAREQEDEEAEADD